MVRQKRAAPAIDEKAKAVFRVLKRTYPDATCELNYHSPLELLVATILSAQCTDQKVNQVTPALFSKCQAARDYVALSEKQLEALIRPTGFYRNKAKSIRGAMEAIVEQHRGCVPETLEELTKLPGVGRKTANVILGNAFGIPGLPVDTHVGRLSNRIGFTKLTDPEKIEAVLNALVPKKNWTLFSHLLIFHGRRVCAARKPACERCPIQAWCEYYESQNS